MITSEVTIGADLRPCGACREYVLAGSCAHWKPRGSNPVRTAAMDEEAKRRKRDRDREYSRAARERARQDVAKFREMMQER